MQTTAEYAYQSLKRMLWAGDLAPGQKVSQARLARQFRCSSVPVVEALRRLESEGLLMKEPRKMARVRILLAAEIEGLFLVRQSLEIVAARLCAERQEARTIEALIDVEKRFCQAAMESNSELSDELDTEIHSLIVRGAQCPLLEQELSRLRLIERTVPGRMTAPDEWDVYAKSHLGIVQAIVAGEAEVAEVLMRKHIQAGYEQTLARARLAPPLRRKVGRPRKIKRD